MKKILLLACTGMAMLCSCSTISHTSSTAGVNTEVYNLTVADMEVSKQKTSKTTEWKWTPLKSVSLEAEKEKATAELLQETNADVLVEPQYVVNRRGIFRGGSVTVSGYPATYHNFRAMNEADAKVIATLDGKMALAYPMINTSSKPKMKSKPALFDRNKGNKNRVRFLDFIAGGITNADVEDGYQIGLMYGKYGQSWGWYVKGVYSHAKGYEEHSYDRYPDTMHGGALTFGVIKTLSIGFSAYAGVGLGVGFAREDFGFGYYPEDGVAMLPIDMGFKWCMGRLSLNAGVTVAPFLDAGGRNYTSSCNVNPYGGIGFTF